MRNRLIIASAVGAIGGLFLLQPAIAATLPCSWTVSCSLRRDNAVIAKTQVKLARDQHMHNAPAVLKDREQLYVAKEQREYDRGTNEREDTNYNMYLPNKG